jgi:CBS domain-containing membrane protein
MQVRDIMTSPVFAVGHTDNLKVVEDLMEWKHVRHLPVIAENDRLVGLITHRDLLRACVSSIAGISRQEQDALLRGIPVQEIMKAEVLTVSPGTDAREAAQIMLDRKIGCLPVVDGKRLVGILTEADYLRYLLSILQ